jgi:nitrate/TMAO reductase-like tetraheme cytochrome c subunit
MTRRALRLAPLLVFSLLFLWTSLHGFDPPHLSSANTHVDCVTPCHAPHVDFESLYVAASNANICQSCHNESGMASALPMLTPDTAVPHAGGFHHAWGVPAENAAAGATPPADAEMAQRIMQSQVVCSTCHNQHFAVSTMGGTPRISPSEKITALGPGAMTSGGTFSGPRGVWYLIEIDGEGSQATATFRWSKDVGISWRDSGVDCGDGADVPLDDGVVVRFSGTGPADFQITEKWQFDAAWPFLRATLDSGDNSGGDRFCRDCHGSWTMDHTSVETYDGSPKGHPVGIPLNANGRGYDRVTPLDGNGAVQGSGQADSNASNDLQLDYAGRVQCLSCHGVHGADSNSLTEDQP